MQAQFPGKRRAIRYIAPLAAALVLSSVFPRADAATVENLSASTGTITDASGEQMPDTTFTIAIEYDVPMASWSSPEITFLDAEENTLSLSTTLAVNSGLSGWSDDYTYQMVWDVNYLQDPLLVSQITVQVTGARDGFGDLQMAFMQTSVFSVDIHEPQLTISCGPSDITYSGMDFEPDGFTVSVTSDRPLSGTPSITFSSGAAGTLLGMDNESSGWFGTSYCACYNVNGQSGVYGVWVDVTSSDLYDTNGKRAPGYTLTDAFEINTTPP